LAKVFGYTSPEFYPVNPVGADDVRWIAIRKGESGYFSGRDAAVYFGDQFIDEIVSIHFAVQEAVLPYYGYASRIWAGIIRGQRQIAGSFTINFKDAGYLYLVLRRLGSAQPAAAKAQPPAQKKAVGPVSRSDLASGINSDPASQRSVSQASVSQSLKEMYWGVNIADSRGKGLADTQQVPIGNAPAFAGPRGGFPIRIVFGQPHVSRAWGTVRGLVGVELMGFRESVEESGKPVLEEYTFIARDLTVES